MVCMVLEGAESWTSRAGWVFGGCWWWWCSLPGHGGFTLERWCSPSAWTPFWVWEQTPQAFVDFFPHHKFLETRNIHHSMFAVPHLRACLKWCQQFSFLFCYLYKEMLVLKSDPTRSHPKKPKTIFVLHLVCSCAAAVPCGHGEVPLLLSLPGLSNQLSSALINGKLSWLTLGW